MPGWIWLARASGLAASSCVVALLAAPARGVDPCPAEAEIARQLQLQPSSGWLTACGREAGGSLLLAAFRPPEGRTEPPELVVGQPPGAPMSVKVASVREKRVGEVTAAAEQWAVRVDRLALGREQPVRVTLTASWGGNQLYTQDLVVLLRPTADGLSPLWVGLGDWTENRFDICLLSGRTRFRLLAGKLERATRIERRRGPAPIDEAPARQVVKECVARPPRRETFTLP
jgi:hypothetical protein